MRNLLAIGLLICSSLGLAVAENKSKLMNVRNIFIGDLGREEGSSLVREKIRLRLMKSDRFSVVETPEAADAILTGVAGVERQQSSSIYTDPSTEERVW